MKVASTSVLGLRVFKRRVLPGTGESSPATLVWGFARFEAVVPVGTGESSPAL